MSNAPARALDPSGAGIETRAALHVVGRTFEEMFG